MSDTPKMSVMSPFFNFGKEDKREKRGSWAPGNYTGECITCGERFVGDKRAQDCADCAYGARPEPDSLGRVELNIEAEAEKLAERFHETYERLATGFGYKTRGESAVPWANVPAANKALMIATCAELLLIDPPCLPPMLNDQAG